ncbi:monooxygenase [Mycobacteroides sp. H001]|uniref:flavin monoamine oxidase family protein n=1 Tax=Mycobacteroides TaxID=670516 RepID=UPI00071317F3|nr:flavin monoamine oxidase family protein [Mycobacteroides chelonae]KRQ24978.1 monooxygenase [Mycobacteroides sp. H072]KRQ37866.1 monooxygenase [Mycobacteroides sp. H002]KRQ47254.1 monooxygenase [Mycobacteroides sp. H054]KRQ69240.1 monooxygenase [Mycobacteroides sp. H001]OHU37957.1 monooxygenase [Mycobacteroides chelonae]
MSKSSEGDAKIAAVDVVIIGAGFAGLSAADRLARMGVSVLVVDARERVGGRSFTGEVAGVKVDLGATWVAERHSAVRDLMARLGCSLNPQFDEGSNVLWMAGQRQTYTGTLPTVGPVDVEDLGRIQIALNTLLETIDVNAAWNSPNAAELDAVSFGEWLDQQQAATSTRALMYIITRVQWGCSPLDVSLLHVLRYIQAVGGLDHMLAVEGGQQEYRVTETTQEIAKRLAEQLGDRVVLDTRVRRISQDENGVTVYTDSATINAKYAIVTAAPQHRACIEYQPALPNKIEGLTTSFPMGALSKAFVAYDKPFWRAEGLSGEALTDTVPVFITFDVSPSDDGPGILMVFCTARVYDGFGPEVRRKLVLKQLADLYGEQANTPIDYIDHCWGTEPFAPGGPHPAAPPYATVSYGAALAEPHGRIHWAGTETAGEWVGTMNGAILTGLHTADQIAQLLGVDSEASA